MKKKIFVQICTCVFLFLVSFSSSVYAKDTDSLKTRVDLAYPPPNFIYQFIGGNAGYAIPFFLFGGLSFIRNGDNITFSIPLGLIGCGFAVTKIGELTSGRDASYWAGIGGALLSFLIGGALYTYSYDHVKSEVIRFFILSIPPTLVSMLWVDLTLGERKDNVDSSSKNPKFEGYLIPEIGKEFIGMRLNLRF